MKNWQNNFYQLFAEQTGKIEAIEINKLTKSFPLIKEKSSFRKWIFEIKQWVFEEPTAYDEKAN